MPSGYSPPVPRNPLVLRRQPNGIDPWPSDHWNQKTKPINRTKRIPYRRSACRRTNDERMANGRFNRDLAATKATMHLVWSHRVFRGNQPASNGIDPISGLSKFCFRHLLIAPGCGRRIITNSANPVRKLKSMKRPCHPHKASLSSPAAVAGPDTACGCAVGSRRERQTARAMDDVLT